MSDYGHKKKVNCLIPRNRCISFGADISTIALQTHTSFVSRVIFYLSSMACTKYSKYEIEL